MDDLLILTSRFLKKDSHYLSNLVHKFCRCYSASTYLAKEQFMKDHYYILVYLIFLFKDKETINDDQVLILIYILYSNIVDDETSRTSYVYPILSRYTESKFDNLVLQINSKLFRHIFDICNNDKFIYSWKQKCLNILKQEDTFTEDAYFLKQFVRKPLIGLSN